MADDTHSRFANRHCKPLIIQDSCSWPYDKTYDTVVRGTWKLWWPEVENVTWGRNLVNLGLSYFHVPLTTVRHVLNVHFTRDMVLITRTWALEIINNIAHCWFTQCVMIIVNTKLLTPTINRSPNNKSEGWQQKICLGSINHLRAANVKQELHWLLLEV